MRAGYIGLTVALAAVVIGPVRAGDEPEPSEEFQKYAQQQAAAYEFRVTAGDQELPANLLEQPLLRWTNPVGGRGAHGEVFLWAAGGRPAAALSLYRWNGPDGNVHEHHEFCSLTEYALTSDNPSGKTFSPQEPGVELEPIADAAPPLDSPRLRLRQMRELAGRFTADKTTRQGEQSVLRLLPQPMYRYADDVTDALDGALFAFVEATDPEVFLLIEARTAEGAQQWHYAMVRMNSVRLRAYYREEPVWEAPELAWRDALNRDDLTYTALTIR